MDCARERRRRPAGRVCGARAGACCGCCSGRAVPDCGGPGVRAEPGPGPAWAVRAGELGAVLLRWRLRRDLRSGRRHGTPATHLLPVGYALSFALVPVALGALQGGPPAVLAGRSEPWLGIALGACALWGWATMLTVSVVDLTRPAQVLAEEREAIGAGELIGVLERLVTFALVLAGALPAVGFVVAAKAAARFPEFKDKAFAEYFLIGTLTSVGLALVLGLVLRP